MCNNRRTNTINTHMSLLKPNAGFTLIELAMVLIVVSVLVGPAIALYHQHKVNQDVVQTKETMDYVSNELGKFSSRQGRYPCPASRTAVPGDNNYGLPTDCEQLRALPVGNCYFIGTENQQVCKYASNISGKNIYVGTLPYKTLNLQENDIYDAYGGKVTYAVTEELTSIETFTLNGGGVGIIDANGDSMVLPADTAHFAIVTHGQNRAGAYTNAGVLSQSCSSGSAEEEENCDGDSVFRTGNNSQTSDDNINFFSAVYPAEWQQHEFFSDNIHMKNINGIAIGASVSDNLDNYVDNQDAVSVLSRGGDTGSIKAKKVITNQLCTEDGSDCLDPLVLGGELVQEDPSDPDSLYYKTDTGGGMSCHNKGGTSEYLVGINNSGPLCEDELFISCPDGSFIQSITRGDDSDGNPKTTGPLQIKCDTTPQPPCYDTEVTTFCGEQRDLPYTISGEYQSVYSGTCHMAAQSYSSSYFAGRIQDLMDRGFGTDVDTLRDAINAEIIDPINALDRNTVACGTVDNSLVRDSYQCRSGDFVNISSHERKSFGTRWTNNLYSRSAAWPAENSYTGDDPSNNNWHHDCWCREDYRAQVYNNQCRNGQDGKVIRIQKHSCPQTSSSWHTVYSVYDFCECAPGETTDTPSCNEFVDDELGQRRGTTTGLTGTVTLTYDVTCNAGSQQTSSTPSSINADSCQCPDNNFSKVTSNCPANTSNSWSWSWTDAKGVTHTGTETGKSALSFREWTCPSSTISTSAGSIPAPGSWGGYQNYTGSIPECTCQDNAPVEEIGSCPAGQEGSITYLKRWNCALNGGTGGYEPKENWEVINDNCNSCAWAAPGAPNSTEDTKLGGSSKQKGGYCSCGSPSTQFCWDYGTGGFDIWSPCTCSAQVE